MDIINLWPEIDLDKQHKENIKRMNKALETAAEKAESEGRSAKALLLRMATRPY